MNFHKISQYKRANRKLLNCMAAARRKKHTGPCIVIYDKKSDMPLPKNLQKYVNQ